MEFGRKKIKGEQPPLMTTKLDCSRLARFLSMTSSFARRLLYLLRALCEARTWSKRHDLPIEASGTSI